MNNNMQWLVQGLRMELMHVPILLISLGAIVIALMRWRRAPQACLCCLLGFGVVFFLSSGMPLLQSFLIFGPAHAASGNMSALMTVFSLAWSLLNAAAYVLLAIAVFVGRARASEV